MSSGVNCMALWLTQEKGEGRGRGEEGREERGDGFRLGFFLMGTIASGVLIVFGWCVSGSGCFGSGPEA